MFMVDTSPLKVWCEDRSSLHMDGELSRQRIRSALEGLARASTDLDFGTHDWSCKDARLDGI